MKYFSLLLLVTCTLLFAAQANDLAQKANDNPFLNGGLNPEYEGQKTGLLGEIIEIKTAEQKFPVYKVKLNIEGVAPIWVTSIAAKLEDGIELGDMIVFKGFITSAATLDPTGELEKLVGDKMLLMAIHSQRSSD